MSEPGKEVTRWADQAMFEAAPMRSVTPSVYLVSATSDPLGAIAAASRMYKGQPTYSLSDITDDERRHYWEESKKTELKAPWEFVDLHFFIEGVDRAMTHQAVRQRTAVYAQESMRFAVKTELPVSKPPTFDQWPKNAQIEWHARMKDIERTYNYMIANGVPGEEARGLLPHATLTRYHYKTNLRNLITEAGKRLCTQAQFHWRQVFTGIVRSIAAQGAEYETPDPKHEGYTYRHSAEKDSWQWQLIASDINFAPVCYQKGHCGFKAEFDRGCTIRKRVDANERIGRPSSEWHNPLYKKPVTSDYEVEIEPIKPAEWMLDPEAGQVHDA